MTDIFTNKYKLTLVLLIYLAFSVWVASGLCFVFFGGNFLDAPYEAIYYFWLEMAGEKGERLKLFAATIIPLLPPLAIYFSDRWGNEELYGSASFANKSEIKKAGLYSSSGVILGKSGGRFLVADGTEHVLLAAPTRSGKGVGFIIPNLLTWDESCLVLDMKFENYDSTSNFRRSCGQKIFQFSPGQRNTHRWNVFDLVDKDDPARIDSIHTIAQFICPTPDNSDPMWSTEARNLFIGAVLYLFDTGAKVTLGSVRRFVLDTSSEELESIVVADFEGELDPECRSSFLNFSKMGDKQQGGVRSDLTSSLAIFGNPLVDYATSSTDFDIRSLKREKTTIYLGATPTSLLKFSPLFNLFFQFFIAENTKVLPDEKTDPYKVLLLLDEFPVLGKMDLIKKGIGYFAGYNLRLAVIAQGLSQIEDIYAKTGQRAFLTNFKYRIFYAPNDDEDAQNVSKALGTKTVKNISDSKPSMINIGSGSRSESHSKAGRDLMMPQEVKMLDRSELLLFVESTNPIKTKKVVYFKDGFFKGKYYNLFAKDSTKGRVPLPVPEVTFNGVSSSSFNDVNEDEGLQVVGEDESLSDDEISSLVEQYFAENIEVEAYEDEGESQSEVYNPFGDDENEEPLNDEEINSFVDQYFSERVEIEPYDEAQQLLMAGRVEPVNEYVKSEEGAIDPFSVGLGGTSLSELLTQSKDVEIEEK